MNLWALAGKTGFTVVTKDDEFAGRTVLVESPEPGVWVIKTATTIPDSELRLHDPEQPQRLDRALAHAAATPGEATDLERLAGELGF